MSDHNEPDSIAPPLQSRRLRLRNSHVNAPPLVSRRRRRSSSASSRAPQLLLPRKFATEDQEWESDDALEHNDGNGYNRTSTSSAFSTASTLVNSSSNSHSGNGRLSASSSRNPSPLPPYHRRNRSNDGRKESRYIEYLERQMADLTAQIQAYTTPSSSSSMAAKHKKLSADNRALRNEILEWEANFDVRLREQASQDSTQVRGLRGQIIELEEKLEHAEEQCRAATIQLRELKQRCQELAGVEEQNQTLEFRIEALSELLAESTRAPQHSVPASVSGSSNRSSLGFPKRISCLPGSATSAVASRRVSRECSSTKRSSGDMSDYGISDPIDRVISGLEERFGEEDEEQELPERPRSSGSYASERPATRSMPFPIRTSSSVPGDGVPLRSRRMRRFPSGSTRPKTLILPSSSTITSPVPPYDRSLYSASSAASSVAYSDSGIATSRPGSSSSATWSHNPEASESNDSFATVRPSLGHHRTSLFAELAACEDYDSNSVASTTNESGTGTSISSMPNSPDTAPQEPPSPSLSDTFCLVADALADPEPLLVKVVDGMSSPTTAFSSARRILSKGVDRVSQQRARVFSTQTRQRRRLLSDAATITPVSRRSTARGCKECGRPTISSSVQTFTNPTINNKRRSLPIEETLDNLWLWIRFIIAVVVALGLAVKDGPTFMLDDAEGIDHVREEERERALRRLEGTARGDYWDDEDYEGSCLDHTEHPR